MEYVVNLMDVDADPVDWARRREDEGWHALSVADHFFTDRRAYPHVWVTAAAMAMATSRPIITTAFANNLFRSPVEVAQAALQLQRLSGGRFELGLGAGWAAAEATGAGLRHPPPGERAGMFAEAAQIVRTLLHEHSCRFDGTHYAIDVRSIGPVMEPPPVLVGSVGGPRTIREVTPHLDRVEIKAQSAATRGGTLDLEAMATVTDDHLVELIARVRAVRPGIPIGMFVLCSVGDDRVTTTIRDTMDGGGPGLFSRFFGSAGHVADGLAWLEALGIGRAQLSPMTGHTLERLAPSIL